MRRLALAATCLLALSAAAPALANIVVPGANAGTEGNLDNSIPFNLGEQALSAMRYQQVYGAAAFGPGPITITGVAFRPDALNGGAFATTLANVSISLSTTAAAVDGLSTTFANNIGADATLVHSGALALSSANTGAGPRNFDIVITFTTPFTYNPANGNLLLEVINFGDDTTAYFDAVIVASDAVSRLYNLDNNPNGATGFRDTLGLVTQFITGAPVPEPATLALLGAGLLGLAATRRRASR